VPLFAQESPNPLLSGYTGSYFTPNGVQMFQTGPGSYWGYGSGRGWNIPGLFGPQNNSSGSFGPSGFTAFDQFAPGVQLGRGGGGIQTSLAGGPMRADGTGYAGIPVTQFGRPINEDPRFADVLQSLYNPINAPDVSGVGRDFLQGGLGLLAPGQGTSPEIQNVMNIIRSLEGTATNSAASRAQALASRRGLAGSSIEQFGVGSAVGEAQRPFTEQSANVLLSEAQRQQQLRDLAARAMFERGGQELSTAGSLAGQFGGYDLARREQIANLTSDELASLRNLREGGANRALQLELGNQATSQANWLASIAQTQANRANRGNSFLGGIGRGFLGGVFGGIGSGIGQGFGSGLFSGGGGGGGFGGGWMSGFNPQFGNVGTGYYG